MAVTPDSSYSWKIFGLKSIIGCVEGIMERAGILGKVGRRAGALNELHVPQIYALTGGCIYALVYACSSCPFRDTKFF